MAKYRKKQALVEATQWFKNGDHPEDNCPTVLDDCGSCTSRGEGQVVRYYRHPIVPGASMCATCRKRMDQHGWLDTPAGGEIVCPGDWIVTTDEERHFKLPADKFFPDYELILE